MDLERLIVPNYIASDDVQAARWKEFEELGEEEVRKRLGAHMWSEDKERLARQWLELRSTSLAREANDLARKATCVRAKLDYRADPWDRR